MLHLFTLLQPGSLVQDLKQTQHSFLEKAPAHHALTQIKIPAHMPIFWHERKIFTIQMRTVAFPLSPPPPLLLMFLCKAHRIRCSSPTHTLTCHGSQWINYALHFFRNSQSLHPMLSATLIPQNPNTFSSELNLLMVWPTAKRHVWETMHFPFYSPEADFRKTFQYRLAVSVTNISLLWFIL